MSPFDQAMNDVLSGAKYNRLTGRSVDIKEVLADAARRFVEFILDRLSINLPELSEVNTDWFVYAFILVGAALLLAVVGVTVRLLSRRTKPVQGGLSELFEEIARNQYTLTDLLRLSQEHADTGNQREAIRYRFIAALVGINERHTVEIEKSKTNAQLLAEITAAEPMLRLPFTQTVECFHWAWFGYKPVSEEQYAQFVNQTDLIIQGSK